MSINEPNIETEFTGVHLEDVILESGNQTLLSYYHQAINGDETAKNNLYNILDPLFTDKTPELQYELGCACLKGTLVTKSKVRATKWFTRAANNDNIDSQCMLYDMLKNSDSKMQKDQAQYWKDAISKTKTKKLKESQELSGKTNNMSAEEKYERGCFYLKFGDAYSTSTAIKWFEKSAELRSKKSLKKLFYIYSEKNGINTSYPDAVRCFIKLLRINNGMVDSELSLILKAESEHMPDELKICIANAYMDLGDDPDFYDEAEKWISKTSSPASADSEYRLGRYCEYYSTCIRGHSAMDWYLSAAGKNQSDAQYRLGKMCERDANFSLTQKALDWYRVSANNNNGKSQYRLGLAYEQGSLVDQSYDEAKVWYEKSAQNNNPKALLKLGNFYEHGIGTYKSDGKAAKMYNSAAKLGNKDAEKQLENILDRTFQNKSCIEMFMLADSFWTGIEHVKSPEYAFKWYLRAADMGHAESQYMTGTFFETGEYAPRSDENAIEYYHMAAEQNHVEAQYRLAMMYLKKNHSRKDPQTRFWLKKASDNGHEKAIKLYYLYTSEDSDDTAITYKMDISYEPFDRMCRNRYSTFPEDYNSFER